jgi:hypothetical protein
MTHRETFPSLEKDPEVFEVGDIVVYDTDIPDVRKIGAAEFKVVDDLIGKYGPGPFKVLKVRESSGPADKNGNNQMITIEFPDGRLPLISHGYWFRRQA